MGEKFELLGDGMCTTRCFVHDNENPYHPCLSSGVQLNRSPENDECRLACENEVSCTGYTISKLGTDCFVHGNISFADIAKWSDLNAWMVGSKNVHGFLGFEVHSSLNTSDQLCYKKNNDELDKGKLSSLSIFTSNIDQKIEFKLYLVSNFLIDY